MLDDQVSSNKPFSRLLPELYYAIYLFCSGARPQHRALGTICRSIFSSFPSPSILYPRVPLVRSSALSPFRFYWFHNCFWNANVGWSEWFSFLYTPCIRCGDWARHVQNATTTHSHRARAPGRLEWSAADKAEWKRDGAKIEIASVIIRTVHTARQIAEPNWNYATEWDADQAVGAVPESWKLGSPFMQSMCLFTFYTGRVCLALALLYFVVRRVFFGLWFIFISTRDGVEFYLSCVRLF